MGIISYTRRKLNDYMADKFGLVGEILTTPVGRLPGAALAAAAIYSAGCAAQPMYDFGAERELFRLENKAMPTERLTVCGRAEMRGVADDQVNIEGIVARGIAEFAIRSGFHAVGNYRAKPNGDIQLLGVGYRGKTGDSNVWHIQAKVPLGDEGSTELEGYLVRKGDRAVLYIQGRYYPITGDWNVEAAAMPKGKSGPVFEVQLTPEETKALLGWRFNL